jgi:streptomycin 6-kinase
VINIPAKLIRNQSNEAPEWLAGLPAAVEQYVDEWQLTITGTTLSGEASLIVPVARKDGTAAMLKLQPVNGESDAEALALRTWHHDDVVEVYEDDAATATILLERLEPQSLNELPDHVEATRIVAEFLVRLSAVPAPPSVRRLADIAGVMLAEAPGVISWLEDPEEQRLAKRFAAMTFDLLPESGDRLLHWDLHYLNVLAAQRQPWLVIDPKPLAGDPAFDIFPVLWNRWDDLVATGNLPRAIRDRFDLMVTVTGIDRDRALGWTGARILQQVIWAVDAAEYRMDAELGAVARALFA